MNKFKLKDLFLHETKKHSLAKFCLLLLIVFGYFLFVSYSYGLVNGFFVTILTWSFFVFCTPIADAGFLIDFPIRLLFGIRMIYTEIFIWLVALFVNVYAILFNSEIYSKTILLNLFNHILMTPIPFWGIIIISGIGTFMSIYFGDELMDISSHNKREKYHKHLFNYQLILFVFVIIVSVLLYYYLIETLGIQIPI
ncbi:MAG: hypothetical protein PHQ98_04230 [Candidatus ainarchaeum sp.]|nr:hypothetical protein [Candidatus ainarchaeum sp.]